MSTEDTTIAGDERPNRTRAPIRTGLSAENDQQQANQQSAPRTTTPSEDSRARAKARAAQLLSHLGTLDKGVDEFYIKQEWIPDGWSYEWKRKSVLNQEEPSYQVSLAEGGWEAVPVERHPHMMPVGWRGAVIERKGMVLMERPAEITEAVKAIDLKRARDQVRQKEEQLNGAPAGDRSPFDPTNRGEKLVRLGKSYEMPIPDK